jgi:hypothetical protein
MTPKPAYDRLAGLIRGRWWTKESGRTTRAGAASFRAFHGDHRVTTDGRGKTASLTVSLPTGGGPRNVTVTLK